MRKRLAQAVKLFGVQKQRFRCQHRALGVTLGQAVTLLRVLGEAVEGGLQVTMQHQGSRVRGACTQVVKHGGRVIKKQRQIIFNAGRGYPNADVFVDAAAGRVALEQLAPAFAELGPGRIVHRELAPWQQPHFGHRVQAALAVRVKGANAVDFVVPQIHAVGHQAAHGEQVNQAAAHRVFAGADDLAHVVVPGQRELCLEFGLVQLLLDLEFKGVSRQKPRRRQAIQRGGGGYQHHISAFVALGPQAAVLDAPQGRQPFADQVLMRRKRVVRQGFPIREHDTSDVGRKKRHFIQQTLSVCRVCRDDGQQLASGLFTGSQLRQQERVGRCHRAGQGVALAGIEFGKQHK